MDVIEPQLKFRALICYLARQFLNCVFNIFILIWRSKSTDTQCIMAEICNKLRECLKRGYQAITDLEYKENMSYDEIEADIEEMNTKWSKLEEETRAKIKETIEYFSDFRENEPEESTFDTIKERASRLKTEYLALLAR